MQITDPGVSMKEIRRRVGLVFQYPEYQLFEETVALDVAFGPKNLGLSEEETESRVREALELVGLDWEAVKTIPFRTFGRTEAESGHRGRAGDEPQYWFWTSLPPASIRERTGRSFT